jgi:2-keto-4-pentenoate hydratase/2-oxohepta-3-ene-1,7-dioic acid hydratase in catechol pathway
MIELPIFNSEKKYPVNPSKIVALGKNYLDHIKEFASVDVTGFADDVPPEPILFAKTPNVLIGPDESIVIPKFIYDYDFDEVRTHHEAELAFFIKQECKNVSPDDACDYILGFTCMNDVSQRNIQKGDQSGWFRGKSFDTFGPVGPHVVLMDDIDDPQNLDIQCRVNGEVKQSSNTKHMIFSIHETVAFISKNFTLLPGDLITTGTPAGVGQISHGDVVEIDIENIGILRNNVLDERYL